MGSARDRRVIGCALLALGALLALASCIPPTSYAFTVHGTLEKQEAFSEALGEWSTCRIVTATTTVDGVPVRPVTSFPGDDTELGHTEVDGNEPEWIEYRADAPNLRAVFAHELGHAFGLHHVATGVMAPDLATPEGFVGPAECEALAGR